MMKYWIKSRNLNNSLVFYRTLFNRMPDHMDINRITFRMDQFDLEIEENGAEQKLNEIFTLEVSNRFYLKKISKRMSRFQSIQRMKNDCEVIDQAIGLVDPDGYKWIIGKPENEVRFEKCYVIN